MFIMMSSQLDDEIGMKNRVSGEIETFRKWKDSDGAHLDPALDLLRWFRPWLRDARVAVSQTPRAAPALCALWSLPSSTGSAAGSDPTGILRNCNRRADGSNAACGT
jgi:hypothetical protein